MLIKKISALMLSAFMLLPAALQVNAAEGYEQNFDTEQSLTGLVCTDGRMVYDGGALHFITGDTYPPVSSITLPHTVTETEYMYSCDISFSATHSKGSFFALAFGKNETGEYRLNIYKDSLLELCRVSADEQYTVLFTDTLSAYKGGAVKADKFNGHEIADEKVFNISVAVKNTYAYIYADGVMIGEAVLPETAQGGVGFCGKGVNAAVDNVKINYTLPPIKGVSTSYECDINTVDGGLSAPFTVIKSDDGSTPDKNTESLRSSTVMFTVRALDGVIYVYTKGNNIGTLEERSALYKGNALPAFRVSDEKTAELLNKYLERESIYDAFIVSSDPGYLKLCLGTGKYRRGVVDYSAYSTLDVKKVADELYENNLRTAIISERAADNDTVYALRSRMITVIVASDDTDASVYNALASGADGVITDRAVDAAALIKELTPETVNKQAVAFIRCGNAAEAVNAAESGAGGVYGELTVRGGVCCFGESPLSEVYQALKETDTVIYLMQDQTQRQTVDELQRFCVEVNSGTDIFLLTDKNTAQYVSALKGIYAHIIGNAALDGENTAQMFFALEGELRAVNSAFITDKEISPEMARLASARGIGIYKMGENTGELTSHYAGSFTEDEYVLAGQAKYAVLTVNKGTVNITCMDYAGKLFLPVGSSSVSYTDGTVMFSGSGMSGEGNVAMQVQNGAVYLTKTVRIGAEAAETQQETEQVGTSGTDGISDMLPVMAVGASLLAVIAGIAGYIALRKKKR